MPSPIHRWKHSQCKNQYYSFTLNYQTILTNQHNSYETNVAACMIVNCIQYCNLYTIFFCEMHTVCLLIYWTLSRAFFLILIQRTLQIQTSTIYAVLLCAKCSLVQFLFMKYGVVVRYYSCHPDIINNYWSKTSQKR